MTPDRRGLPVPELRQLADVLYPNPSQPGKAGVW